VPLDSHPDSKAKPKFNQKELIRYEEIATDENVSKAPQKRSNQEQKGKPLLSIPGPVGQQND